MRGCAEASPPLGNWEPALIEQIEWVVRRDGEAAARQYAEQTLRQYRAAAKPQPDGRQHFAHVMPFRPHFVRSIVLLRQYLRATRK
jgi:plasmid stabilization system protein ParE